MSKKRLSVILILVLFLLNLLAAQCLALNEQVIVYSVVSDYQGTVLRPNGDMYLIQCSIGYFTLAQYLEQNVVIICPGSDFGGPGSILRPVYSSMKLDILDARFIKNINGTPAPSTTPTKTDSSSTPNAQPPTETPKTITASFKVGSSEYTVNGQSRQMDVSPYIKDGRTFMPLRYVADALDVKADGIGWDETTKTISLMKGNKIVQVKIGSTTMLVNGTSVEMDTTPEINGGRTMLPLRFITQALGANLTWNEDQQVANITLAE